MDTLVDIASAETDRLLSGLQDRLHVQPEVALAGVWRAVIGIRCARGHSIKLREIERELIETVLELNNGSRTETAKPLRECAGSRTSAVASGSTSAASAPAIALAPGPPNRLATAELARAEVAFGDRAAGAFAKRRGSATRRGLLSGPALSGLVD